LTFAVFVAIVSARNDIVNNNFGGDKVNNDEIRKAAKDAGLKLWEVADALGMQSDSAFSRKLRRELPQDEKTKIFSIIEQLKTAREGEAM